MQYINQKLSAKLEKLGVKSESEMCWDKIGDEFIIEREGSVWAYVCPAYTLLDIFNPDNLKMLFGDHLLEDRFLRTWEFRGYEILRLCWQGWEQIEEYLEKHLNKGTEQVNKN